MTDLETRMKRLEAECNDYSFLDCIIEQSLDPEFMAKFDAAHGTHMAADMAAGKHIDDGVSALFEDYVWREVFAPFVDEVFYRFARSQLEQGKIGVLG